MRIETNRKRIPWSWAFIALFPWVAISIREQISISGMTFTLRRFIDDPAMIGRILSSNYAFSLTVGSLIAFLSDHIWTRWGRRRPFLLLSFFSSGLLSFLIPFPETAWMVIAMIIAYQLLADFSGPYEPITMEVVPPDQRGRSQAISHWFKTGGFILTYYVLIAGFDKSHSFLGFDISGEQVMYWANGLFLIISGAVVLFFIREKEPARVERKPLVPLIVNDLLKELLKPRMLLLMGLTFSLQNLWTGTGSYEALLVTDQWGYTKEIYSKFMAYSMLVTVCLVPIAGWISDRIDRMILLKFCLISVLGLKVLFYAYVQYIAEGTPPLAAVFAIGFMKSTVASFMSVACVPLIFDYVPNNRLGLLGCAMSLVIGLVSFVGANVMGEWIKYSSRHIYGLPEGTWEYMAAYHWLIFIGILGIGYLYFFSHMERKGVITRLSREEMADQRSKA